MDKEKKLKEGEEVFFIVSEKQMEKTQVEQIDKKQGFALLSNRVKITRTPTKEGTYQRLDGKQGFAIQVNEESEKQFQAIRSYFNLSRNIEELNTRVRKLEVKDNPDLLIELDKKITKLLNRL